MNEITIIEEKLICTTYFRTSDVKPFVDSDNKLHIFNGTAYSASWGSSTVTSTVDTVNGIVMVKVVGWHKHTVGPVGGTYYFVNEDGKWVNRTANNKAVKAALGAMKQWKANSHG